MYIHFLAGAVDDHSLVGVSWKSGDLADYRKRLGVNDTKYMRFRVWSAAVLHIKIFVYGIVGAMVHAFTQLEGINDFVALAIHQCQVISVAVRDDKAI